MKQVEKILCKYYYRVYNNSNVLKGLDIVLYDCNWGISLMKAHILRSLLNYENCSATDTNII
jgi:hypothetical protein